MFAHCFCFLPIFSAHHSLWVSLHSFLTCSLSLSLFVLSLSARFCHVVSDFLPGVGSAYVEQLPFLTGSQGQSLVLQCTLKQSNCDSMFWYRQRGSRELEGLFYSYGDQLVNFTAELLTAQRSNKNWDLKWSKLSRSDSAVYYCACSTAQ